MEILYKYMSAELALKCLPEVGDGTLRATQPSALNDPFECSAQKTFVEEDRDSKKLAEVLSSINETTPVGETEVMRRQEMRWASMKSLLGRATEKTNIETIRDSFIYERSTTSSFVGTLYN